MEVKQTIEQLQLDIEHWTPIYEKSKADIEFLSDDDCAQWDAKDFAARRNKKRPTLTIDQLGQFVNQVSNDVRMNTPTINVVPNGGGADIAVAAVYKGLIRDIEQRSRSDVAYDTAVSFSIEGSIGFFRIDHDYVNGSSFDQELKFTRVVNPHMIFFDRDSIEPDGSDGKRATAIQPMTIDEFKSRWPGKEAVGISVEQLPALEEGKELYVAEHFYVTETPGTLYRMQDGREGIVEGEVDPESMGGVAMSRKTTIRKVYRCWLSGKEELEKTRFPGEYVGIIPVYGKEAWLDGKRHLHSLIRKSKDGQRMFNYWKSMEAELLMKQPKAPVIAARGSIEAHAKLYNEPDGSQALIYEPYDEQGRALPAPILGNTPRIPEGVVMAARACVDDIKSTMGLYNASVGQRSNEVSGKAINARQQQGDKATFHFGDNLLRSIQFAGVVLVSAIPDIYNTPRVVGVVGMEDTAELLGINGARVKGQEEDFDLRKGKYRVNVTTGAPFATMRQEAAEFFKQVVMTTPELMQVIGDLAFKYQDFPGAQAVSERLKRLLPPQALGEQGDPQAAAAQEQLQKMQAALMQSQAEVQQLGQQLKNKTLEVQTKAQTELAKNETEKQKQQLELMHISLEQQQMKADYQVKLQEIAVKREELELKRQELIVSSRQQALAAKQQPRQGEVK